jgi:type IV pilus assembly protein PilM
MAAQKRIYTLNLGTQTISLAEFVSNPSGGVILTRFKQSSILGDPAIDPARVAQTKFQVEQLATEFGLKHVSVNYAIASHVVFTRPVRLPSVEATKVEEIVGFEAAQNVPYPIDQVVWDWQLLDEGKGGQMEVILAAIKSDLLDEINGAVEGGGFRTGTVEIAPMALYNALRYNYADATGCTLLVDIGSRTTNLLFCEPGKIFPRRLNLGGSTITTAVAKDLGGSFAEADQRKEEDGFVSLGGSYTEPDDVEIARISKIIRNQMTRLHQEIARSITFYRSEHGGSAPERVLLAGGTASLPYMREFFQEKFPGMEVEYFNPLRNVAIANTLNAEEVGRVAHMLGELVGLALRSAVSCPMELNLRPVSVARSEKAASQKPYLIAAGACLLAGLLGWWQYYENGAKKAAAAADELESTAGPLTNAAGKMKESQSKIDEMLQGAAPLMELTRERSYWVNVLSELNASIPQDYIWITSFEPPKREDLKKAEESEKASPAVKKGAKAEAPPILVQVRGLYMSTDAGNAQAQVSTVDAFIEKLKEAKYVKPVDPAEDPEFIRGQDNPTDWAFKYQFKLKLQNPIDLK